MEAEKGFEKGENQNQARESENASNQKVFGGLLINVATSMNEMIVEAHKGGKVACEDRGEKSLIDLLTKRFNPKKRYSSKAVQIFNNLKRLSGIPKHTFSGK